MKDRDQKHNALRYCVSKRWYPQLEVDVHSLQGVARKAVLMTDLDVFASIPDDFGGYRKAVFDCKTLSRESPINRSMWLRGVLDRLKAEHGFCILRKASIEADHRLVADQIGVFLLAEDEFDIFAAATSPQYGDALGHTANIDNWEQLFAVANHFPALEPALVYLRSTYWMQDDPGAACRKTVAALHEVRNEFDPEKSGHVAMVADFCSIFARSLAVFSARLFRAYLHPKHQERLEEAAKVMLYGGRDAYEHRNHLYRLLKEKAGVETGNVDLALPDWAAYIKLLRQLLDAPVAVAQSPLIIRELGFACLLDSNDLSFAKQLCQESPQAGRFAVLIVSYLLKSAKLPREFSEKITNKLISLL